MKKGILPALLCAMAPATVEATIVITPIASGFNQSTTVTANSRLDGDDRVFVLQKGGVIKVFKRSGGAVSTFNDLSSDTVAQPTNELGLLGMTFDPDYATNGRYYVFVTTRPAPGSTTVNAEVRRYTDPLIASEASQTVWQKEITGHTNHVGGWIDFDNQGKLLIAVGDGGNGSVSDVHGTGQNPGDIYGSILRIDPKGDAFPADPSNNYTIPADNPAIAGAIPELYAYGLRNPYRNSVAPDGNLIIADVGQDLAEEITILAPGNPGRNLGWALAEGTAGSGLPADYVAPAYEYLHAAGIGQAVIGGYVYRGTEVPELFGRYVFGDQVSGNIWSIGYDGTGFVDGTLKLIGHVSSLSSFGETVDGELLVTQYWFGTAGQVFAITSVPESGTWAMMLAGFMLCGGAMRARGARRSPQTV